MNTPDIGAQVAYVLPGGRARPALVVSYAAAEAAAAQSTEAERSLRTAQKTLTEAQSVATATAAEMSRGLKSAPTSVEQARAAVATLERHAGTLDYVGECSAAVESAQAAVDAAHAAQQAATSVVNLVVFCDGDNDGDAIGERTTGGGQPWNVPLAVWRQRVPYAAASDAAPNTWHELPGKGA